MNRVPIDLSGTVQLLHDVLSKGGVAVVPTDTLYGLSAALSSSAGYDRIVSMKRCGADRRFIYLASDTAMVERYINSWGCVCREALGNIWPAPLTGVFRSGSRCPRWIGPTIALRVPEPAFLRTVAELLGEPILSTSVNETGQSPLDDVEEITRRFGAAVDLIVERGPSGSGEPSTVVDFTGEAPVVLRRGHYAWDGAGKPSN